MTRTSRIYERQRISQSLLLAVTICRIIPVCNGSKASVFSFLFGYFEMGKENKLLEYITCPLLINITTYFANSDG